MNPDLYFIPILAKALHQPDCQNSLSAAFGEIQRLGQQASYRRGLAQFEMFMESVGRSHAGQEIDHTHGLLTELACGTFTGSAETMQAILEQIRSHPDWRAEFEAVSHETAEALGRTLVPVIRILRDSQLVGELVFAQAPQRKSAGDMVPGHYQLRFLTGRLLWEGDLTARDLIWAAAFPGQDLDLAAETDESEGRPTRQIELWDGEIMVRVYAELESGRIEVELTR